MANGNSGLLTFEKLDEYCADFPVAKSDNPEAFAVLAPFDIFLARRGLGGLRDPLTVKFGFSIIVPEHCKCIYFPKFSAELDGVGYGLPAILLGEFKVKLQNYRFSSITIKKGDLLGYLVCKRGPFFIVEENEMDMREPGMEVDH